MQTNARIAAVIEILEGVLACAGSAELVLRRYLRGRRYIGSKDRRALQDLTFAIIRRRGLLQWNLEQARLATDGARALMITHLALEPEPITTEEIGALFSGAGYAPTILTDEERGFLKRLAGVDAAVPDWARLNIPQWLEPELKTSLGKDFEAQLDALNREAPVDVRVNTLKCTREEAVLALQEAGIAAEPTAYSPVGLHLEKRVPWGNVGPYKDGLIEPQDEGSQILGLITDPRPGQTVIDLCAGAGGKTLALAAAMENEGRLVATDIAAGRLARAAPRLERAGVEIVETMDNPSSVYKAYVGQADRVLADSPCTGSGAWRRQPAARWCLSRDDLDRFQQTQSDLLARAATLVKPGGRLIYATCSLFHGENEGCAIGFDASSTQFRRLSAAEIWHEIVGDAAPFDGDDLKFTPGSHNTDGVFAAIWERVA